LVFMIVLGTVLLNATTARLFAKMVGVFLTKSEGILILGASKASRLIADYIHRNNRHVVLIDNNQNNVAKAKKLGLEALTANIYSDTLPDNIELNDIGYLMALTGNSDINEYAIEKFTKQFGENGSFRLVNAEEMNDPENNPKEGLFSYTDDYIKMTETARRYPAVHEIELKDGKHYEGLIEMIKAENYTIPILLKTPEGDLRVISSYSTEFNDITEGSKLVYLGKTIDVEKSLDDEDDEVLDEDLDEIEERNDN
ncbi:MAG TPA: NAD-binding protein, partial [Pricia sp.]|nr:NAD-binding protein [Pricia sp.]